METRNFYKCFISSPGDCELEREVANTIISKMNSELAKHLNVNFESFMWEYDVLPDFNGDGQDTIDEYIEKSNYDIFIGIMKNKYGHPTKKAGSGTVHEFNDALKRKKLENNIPLILFFFGKESLDPDHPDLDNQISQYKKVKEFKSKIGSEGLYINFNNIEDFGNELKSKLELFVKKNSPLNKVEEKSEKIREINNRLECDLIESLKTYNESTPIWIEPILSSKKEIPNDPSKNRENQVAIDLIIDDPKNFIIKAPSEFGMSSLAHYLKLEAFKKGKYFLYIDSKNTKKHKILNDIKSKCENYFATDYKNIDCILIDSVSFEEIGVMPMIKLVCDEFPSTPIIIFNTLENNFFLKSDEDEKVEIKREFDSLYLLPLPQNDVRKIVNSYATSKVINEDNDVILNKVTKDMEILNMHRTAKNCISILRASSKFGNDFSPINRTKLLETILNTIFEEYNIPTYKDKKPDIKECSFVLGYFCELLITNNSFEFTKDFYLEKLTSFCKINFIDLDLNYLLTLLFDNTIFSQKSDNLIFFKNAYWVFFFVAQRMYMNEEFRDKIYRDKRYIDFPEIMEFYTGIDRNRTDALKLLSNELELTLKEVISKVNIPDSINPYKSITWAPDVESLEKEEAIISKNVISSGLPDEIKDKYEDRNYNQIRPYNQVINSVMRDYSFLVLIRQLIASSRALRNSDFVNSDLKQEVLNKIILAWNEINKLLIVISPLLAEKGDVSFEGAHFYLNEDDFKDLNEEQKRLEILLGIPSNVVKFFKDDLYSVKMGPLLIEKAKTENNNLLKHEMMILIIAERPKNWNKTIDGYIVNLDKNSFYLADILSVLTHNFNFKATEVGDRRIIELLLQKCRAKHLFNQKNPDLGLINRARKIK